MVDGIMLRSDPEYLSKLNQLLVPRREGCKNWKGLGWDDS